MTGEFGPSMSLRQLRHYVGATAAEVARRTGVASRSNMLMTERRPLEVMQMQSLRRHVEDGLGCDLVVCAIGEDGEVTWVLDPPGTIVARHRT